MYIRTEKKLEEQNNVFRSKMVVLFAIYVLAIMSVASIAKGAGNDVLVPKQYGNVSYITGGIGDQEKGKMQSVWSDYNFHLMSSMQSGGFSGVIELSITNKSGKQVFAGEVDPMLYADLPAGTYTVIAVNQGMSKQEKITVSDANPASVHFIW